MNNREKLIEATMRALQGKLVESVAWNYFDKFKDVVHKYLPSVGEGDTFATQLVTAINMLIYKWYNDGDVYDNNYAYFTTCGNDLSSYANWLYKYVDGTQDTLDKIKDCFDGNDYERIIKRLADEFLTDEYLNTCKDVEKQGSIYDCSGPFEFNDNIDDEEYY